MHTEGPWEWDGNVCNYDPAEEAPWLMAGTERILSGEIICRNPDDAILIKAAPDLLEALKTILPLAKGYRPENQTMRAATTCASWIASAEAAISKALGQ